jgi:hypothetical protein
VRAAGVGVLLSSFQLDQTNEKERKETRMDKKERLNKRKRKKRN